MENYIQAFFTAANNATNQMTSLTVVNAAEASLRAVSAIHVLSQFMYSLPSNFTINGSHRAHMLSILGDIAAGGSANHMQELQGILGAATTAQNNATDTAQAGTNAANNLVQTDTSTGAQLSGMVDSLISTLSNPSSVS